MASLNATGPPGLSGSGVAHLQSGFFLREATILMVLQGIEGGQGQAAAAVSTIRRWRRGKRLKLEAMCDLLEMRGCKRPSAAKLSRIERGQKIPSDMIGAFVSLTGIPAA